MADETQPPADTQQGDPPDHRAEPWRDPETARQTIEALRRENARHRTDRKTTEQAPPAQAQEAERRALVYEVALDKGLTASQARRLAGGSKEELEADADAYLAELGQGTRLRRRPSERLTGGSGGDGAPPADDMNQLIRAHAGR